jgi:D-tyrosyl-tRNA(Tyr) deacylase
MRAVLQRVAKAVVSVNSREVASIDRGLLVLLGVHEDDSNAEAVWLAGKLAGLRVFEDDRGKMNLSVLDVDGTILAVSQFTLLADCRKGKRPSFTDAKDPEEGRRLFDLFVDELRGHGLEVATGVFGAKMEVSLVNDGPVTVVIDTPDSPR